MTDRLPSLKDSEVIRALEKAGLRSYVSLEVITGLFTNPILRATTVPVHKGRDLPRPFLRAILKGARLTLLNSLIFFDGACPAHLLLANFGSISRQFREIPCFGRITA